MVKIVIKSWDDIYKETVRDIKNGTPQKEDKIIYIDSIEVARKLMTPERMKLLSTVKGKKPGSLYALAKLLKKDMKTIVTDTNLLSDFGLLSLETYKEGARTKVRPRFEGRKINLELPI